MTIARITYQGGTPSADTNNYSIFSTESFGQGYCAHAGVARITVSLLGDNAEGGTLVLQRGETASTGAITWTTVHDDSVTFATGEAQVYDYQISQYPHCRVYFTNDGSAKTVFAVDAYLSSEHTPHQ